MWFIELNVSFTKVYMSLRAGSGQNSAPAGRWLFSPILSLQRQNSGAWHRPGSPTSCSLFSTFHSFWHERKKLVTLRNRICKTHPAQLEFSMNTDGLWTKPQRTKNGSNMSKTAEHLFPNFCQNSDASVQWVRVAWLKLRETASSSKVASPENPKCETESPSV